MFDYVTCELPMPDGREVVTDSFQTKSLWCGMDRFTITSASRLVLHRRRYLPASDPNDEQLPRELVHVADIDLDFHGDLAIHGETRDGRSVDYAVRFTHGTVEWIRDLDGLSEIHRIWLIERER
jgi:hypothetical protein